MALAAARFSQSPRLAAPANCSSATFITGFTCVTLSARTLEG
jgi:hypothetical protein